MSKNPPIAEIDAPAHPFATELPACPFGRCDGCTERRRIAAGWDFEYHTTPVESVIVRCDSCGVLHPTRLPVAEAMSTIYPPHYYAFSETTHENPIVRRVRAWVAKRKAGVYQEFLPSEGAEVLEVGCGDGRLLDILRSARPSWRYSGLDWSEDAIERIRAKGYDGRSGNVESLDLPDWRGKFHLILMHQVIEHVRFPRQVLINLRELLTPGGVLAIETPDIDAWDYKVFRDRYWAGYHIPRHFFIFNKENFSYLARETGYEVVRVRSIINPVAWIHSIKSVCADTRWFRWLAPFFHHQNPVLLSVFTPIELVQTRVFGKSSNMQLFLRRPVES